MSVLKELLCVKSSAIIQLVAFTVPVQGLVIKHKVMVSPVKVSQYHGRSLYTCFVIY